MKVAVAWQCVQQLRGLPRPRRVRSFASLPNCPIPEVARLGRTWTLPAWLVLVEFLACHDTAGASNGRPRPMNLLIERGRRDVTVSATSTTTGCDYWLAGGVRWQTPATAQNRTRNRRLVA